MARKLASKCCQLSDRYVVILYHNSALSRILSAFCEYVMGRMVYLEAWCFGGLLAALFRDRIVFRNVPLVRPLSLF